MRMQNSGEEKQTGERVQKQNQQVIECGAKQEEGKMTVKILAWVIEKLLRRPLGRAVWGRGERLHLEMYIIGDYSYKMLVETLRVDEVAIGEMDRGKKKES